MIARLNDFTGKEIALAINNFNLITRRETQYTNTMLPLIFGEQHCCLYIRSKKAMHTIGLAFLLYVSLGMKS